MRFHPLAELFPLLEGDAFDRLAADIRDHGLLEPITLYEGMILDGRNRWRACEAAGVKPHCLEYHPSAGQADPLGFVMSENLRRRHLDESQRAMVAARLANMQRTDTLNRGSRSATLPNGAISQADAAEMLNVSTRAVTGAKAVQDKATPALIQAVDRGDIAVSVAAGLAAAPESVQRQAVAEPKRAHVFVKQAARAERERELGARQLAWPTKIYGVIYTDPPWPWTSYSQITGMDRAPIYPVMTPETIKAHDVQSIAAENCVLFLCATFPLLPLALEVMAAWGFAYKTGAAWDKQHGATGYWFTSRCELLLLGTRGQPPCPAPGEQWKNLISEAAREHSRKPDEAYLLIESYFPTLPKIELFARGAARRGWDAWGNEAEPTQMGEAGGVDEGEI
jgi:N6-adenosine-specific RNA methylase IME4/ParB-like chromosome segregation protein Spo0J